MREDTFPDVGPLQQAVVRAIVDGAAAQAAKSPRPWTSARRDTAKAGTDPRGGAQGATQPGESWRRKVSPGILSRRGPASTEGDKILGLRAPALHRLTREYSELDESMRSRCSHHRGTRSGCSRYSFSSRRIAARMTRVAGEFDRAYLANARYVNNWDLVDCSAGGIRGTALEAGNIRAYRTTRALRMTSGNGESRLSPLSASSKRGEFRPTLRMARDADRATVTI